MDNIVAYHGDAHTMFNNGSKVKTTNQFFDKVSNPSDLCMFVLADSSAKGCGITPEAQKEHAFLKERLDVYEKRATEPMVTGYDLIKMGLKPSTEFSEMLAHARKLHFSGVEKAAVIKDIAAHNKDTVDRAKVDALLGIETAPSDDYQMGG